MEKFINLLERRIRRFAIRDLMKYVSFGMIAFYLASFFFQGTITVLGREQTFLGLLVLDRDALFAGQVWRLISYIFLPPDMSLLFLLLSVYLYYMIGTNLERQWGSARFNIYYLIGMFGTTVAALLVGFGTNTFLNYSLFFAFAALFPNVEFRIFFFLPVKVKYLAYLNAAFFAYSFVVGDWSVRAMILVSLLNFFLFFSGRVFLRIKVRVMTVKTRRNFRRNMRK